MSHPLMLGLFESTSSAAAAARALRALGLEREEVSIVARSHDEEGDVADAAGASPGAELEDSRVASRLGELSAHVLAAAALVIPGVGPIVADGPLAAGLGEAAGHIAGGIARTLQRAGLDEGQASEWETRIEGGALLVGAHVDVAQAAQAKEILLANGAVAAAEGTWGE